MKPYTPCELGRRLRAIADRVENADTAQDLADLHTEIIEVLIAMSETEASMSRGRYDA
jgi:hypothetical protein